MMHNHDNPIDLKIYNKGSTYNTFRELYILLLEYLMV